MMKNRTYLDYNATAPLLPSAKAALSAALDSCGNPSSIHQDGRNIRRMIETAREQLAQFINCRSTNIIFTASATEANNTILSGLPQFKVFLVGATEHPSVLNVRADALPIDVDANGIIDLQSLKTLLEQHKDVPCLVSVQLVNGETGIIQPVAAIAEIVHQYGGRIHCDAVQALGRIPVDFAALNVDYMSLSAHKIGGGMGVGALIAADLRPFEPLIKGGGQERRRRAGTENTPAIIGFGAACAYLSAHMMDIQKRLAALQTELENGLSRIAPDMVIIGRDSPRVANTTLALFPHKSAETLLMNFDLEGISVSTGSACSSGSVQASHVLKAMGFSDNDAKSVIRFSTGWQSDENDIHHALSAFERIRKRAA